MIQELQEHLNKIQENLQLGAVALQSQKTSKAIAHFNNIAYHSNEITNLIRETIEEEEQCQSQD